jgi:hypothetical protein
VAVSARKAAAAPKGWQPEALRHEETGLRVEFPDADDPGGLLTVQDENGDELLLSRAEARALREALVARGDAL